MPETDVDTADTATTEPLPPIAGTAFQTRWSGPPLTKSGKPAAGSRKANKWSTHLVAKEVAHVALTGGPWDGVRLRVRDLVPYPDIEIYRGRNVAKVIPVEQTWVGLVDVERPLHVPGVDGGYVLGVDERMHWHQPETFADAVCEMSGRVGEHDGVAAAAALVRGVFQGATEIASFIPEVIEGGAGDPNPEPAVEEEADMPRPLSVSGAKEWDKCPAAWDYKYNQKRPSVAGGPAVLGTLVHSALEDLMTLEPAERTTDAALHALETRFRTEVADGEEYLSLQLDAEAAKAFREEATVKTLALFDVIDPTKVDVVAPEIRLRAKLAGVPFLGIVDLVTAKTVGGVEGVIVTDYKSGKVPMYKGQLSLTDVKRQMLLYAAALEAVHGVTVHRAVALYLGSQAFTIPVNDRNKRAAKRWLRDIWRAIGAAKESGEYPTQTGPLCAWCDHVEVCDAGQAEVASRVNNPKQKVREDAPVFRTVPALSTAEGRAVAIDRVRGMKTAAA